MSKIMDRAGAVGSVQQNSTNLVMLLIRLLRHICNRLPRFGPLYPRYLRSVVRCDGTMIYFTETLVKEEAYDAPENEIWYQTLCMRG